MRVDKDAGCRIKKSKLGLGYTYVGLDLGEVALHLDVIAAELGTFGNA